MNIMTRRGNVSVSCLPRSGLPNALVACQALFGGGFTAEDNPLISTLANTNAITHVPLALFNWTRIERGENWPQYHFMTPRVASVIEKLDAERRTIANAFGFHVRSIDQHFSQSFNTDATRLEDVAAELHRMRGGPPGPTDVRTRFLSEDVPSDSCSYSRSAVSREYPLPLQKLCHHHVRTDRWRRLYSGKQPHCDA